MDVRCGLSTLSHLGPLILVWTKFLVLTFFNRHPDLHVISNCSSIFNVHYSRCCKLISQARACGNNLVRSVFSTVSCRNFIGYNLKFGHSFVCDYGSVIICQWFGAICVEFYLYCNTTSMCFVILHVLIHVLYDFLYYEYITIIIIIIAAKIIIRESGGGVKLQLLK